MISTKSTEIQKTELNIQKKKSSDSELNQISMLAQRLGMRSSDLYGRAQHIYRIAMDEIYPNQTLPAYTDHGIRHIKAVLEFADKLVQLPKENQPQEKMTQEKRSRVRCRLTDGESFLLIVSILLHDIGQLYHDYTYSDPTNTFAEHGDNGARLIIEYADKFGLNGHEADVIAKICRSHCLSEYRSELPESFSIHSLRNCRLHSVMAILRIADLLDLTYTRAPSFIFRIKGFPSQSRKHWKRHAVISDVRINSSDWRITVYARPEEIKQWFEIQEFHGWLDKELQQVLPDFNKLDLNFTHIDLIVDQSSFSQKAKPSPKANPFPGLSPFSTAEADLFFGRDKEIEKIIALSLDNRFMSLVGESGVGKTSLVHAGIIPKLEARDALCLTYRFSSPIDKSLITTICRSFRLSDNSSWSDIINSFSKLNEKSTLVFLYIDQFEELFTLSFAAQEMNKFKQILVDLLTKVQNLRVIISIRSEFLLDLWEIAKMNPIIFSRENIYRVSHLSPEMATDAMKNPLLKFSNLRWDEKLIEQVIDDLTDQNPAVFSPYLQLVCWTLVNQQFKEIGRLGKTEPDHSWIISPFVYEDLGRAEKIINDYFQRILDRFSPQEREVIDEILSNMITEFSSRKPISYEDVTKINKNRINAEKAMRKLIDDRVVKRVHLGYELEHDLLAKKLVTILRETPRASNAIRKVIDYMVTNKALNIISAELGRVAELSTSQMRRRFKAETGKKPAEYLNKLRIEEAKKLLQETSDHVKLIAEQCGFKTPIHFINTFKDLNDGITPLAYRKIARESYKKEFDESKYDDSESV